MATEKKDAAIEAEVRDVEEVVEAEETEVSEAEEVVEAEVVEVPEAEEVTEAEESEVSEAEDAVEAEEAEVSEAEEVTEAEEAEVSEAEEVTEANEAVAAPVRKESSKRIKKAERREAKAARKAANKIEEKKSRPNNALIALLIFGVVVGMFAFVLGYNYFSKPATIAKYIEENGGEETYGTMQIDAFTTANITADGNSMNIVLTAEADDETIADQIKDYYSGDDGKEQLEYIAAYFLTNIKPQTRAFSADAKASISLNGEELNSIDMTFKEAKEMMEEEEEEAEEAAEDAEDEADDAEDAEESEDDD